jgi:hypothetical protein
MRQLIGVGTPRGLQGRHMAVLAALLTLIRTLRESVRRHRSPVRLVSRLDRPSIARSAVGHFGVREMDFVAVGTAVIPPPPHRSVRAELLHTAPTLDEWRQSARSDEDAEYGRWESTG